MSGGSFDYTCFKMQDGEVDQFFQNVDGMISAVHRNIDLARAEAQFYAHGRGHYVPTDTERAEYIVALEIAIARLEYGRAAVAVARRTVKSLAGIAHAIEWCESGDSGHDDIVEEALKMPGTEGGR